ncbi:MAG: hypothetical protein ABI761_14970 [Saprospiraceae bacterium]
MISIPLISYKKAKWILFSLALIISFSTNAQIGDFEISTDIGKPKYKGSSVYNNEDQTYTIKGGGYNIWFNYDEFHYLYRKIKGDFLLSANFEMIGNENGSGHRKTGWMIRESSDDNAVCILTCLHGDGTGRLTSRILRGAFMRDPEEMIFFPKQYYGENIIQLERIGKKITMRIAHPGEPLEEMGSVLLNDLKNEVLVGPYVLAHDTTSLQEAKIWNVRITTPVSPDWIPNIKVKLPSNENVLTGSRLETVNINTGMRKIIYESSNGFTNPYYLNPENKLCFQQKDKTFGISTNGGSPIEIQNAKAPTDKLDDGNYIYFQNGIRSTNQIWRKKKDETETIQLTHDLDQAWFPHVSPDGHWIAYVSFSHISNPKAPMLFQNVQLKILPLSSIGAPKTIAYFFGGKGSFENYGWSPDSKSIVFMSNY